MAVNITIDQSSLHGSDHSSFSDEEDSSGIQVSPTSDSEEDWGPLPYPDELRPSDSASRPRTSHRSRNSIHGSRSASGRRHSSRRRIVHERDSFSHRPRRRHSPESPESVDSSEEYGGPYVRAPQERRFWQPMAPGPAAPYPHNSSPGSPYNAYRRGTVQHGSFAHPHGPHPPSDQLIRLAHSNPLGHQTPYGHPPYTYGAQFQHPHGASMPPFFVHEHNLGQHGNPAHDASHQPTSFHVQNDAHNPPRQPLPHTVPPNGTSPYGLRPLGTHDLIPYNPGNYYNFRESYPMVPGIIPPYFGPYPRVPSPPQAEKSPPLAPAPTETAKDEAIARLEKLILEERTVREAREAQEAAEKAAIEKAAAEKAAREERAAHEKKIAEEAAALARSEAEQKAAEEAARLKKEAEEAAAAAAAEAEKKAAEAAAKAKKDAEEAAAAAAVEAEKKAAEAAAKAKKDAEEAAAAAAVEAEKKASEAAAKAKKEAEEAAAAKNRPPEKKKPVKFKDAVGRKFSFPFELCCTWQGMEELIRQAFLHIEVIGPHVAEGHYDLVGPNGDIILPQVWETVVEPDWTITMHMWPIPEKPQPAEPAPPPPPAPEAPPAPEITTVPEAAAPAEPAPPEAPALPEAASGAAEPAPPETPEAAVDVVSVEPKKATGPKKQRPKAPDPGAFAMWMAGSNRLRLNKASQKKKV